MPRQSKRIRYVSDEITSSEEECDYLVSPALDETYLAQGNTNQINFQPSSTTKSNTDRPESGGRKAKCFSRNALMARENRLKKKMYIANLERQVSHLQADNKKLAASSKDQSDTIRQLRKQVKYLHSVLRNSTALGQLIGNIRGTGMSFVEGKGSNTSNLSRDCCIQQEKHNLIAARKTAHPWHEQCNVQSFVPASETDFNQLESVNWNLFDDFDILSSSSLDVDCEKTNLEHSYATNYMGNNQIGSDEVSDSEEDAGICLHVSKERLSIEFCQLCSDNSKSSPAEPN